MHMVLHTCEYMCAWIHVIEGGRGQQHFGSSGGRGSKCFGPILGGGDPNFLPLPHN